MCQENGNISTSQGTSQGAIAGIAGQKTLRKQRAGTKAPVTFFADSLASLRVLPKTGPEVFYFQETIDNGEDFAEGTFMEMIDDLWMVYKDLQKAIGFKEVENESDIKNEHPALALNYLFGCILKLLPEGFEFNIEYNDRNDHFITIYSECTYVNGWNVIEIGKLVKKLKRYNEPLHDLFICFIASFANSLNVSLWWQGEYGHTLERMDERRYEFEEDMEEDMHAAWVKEINYYKKELPNDYKQLIKNTHIKSAKLILEQLETLKRVPVPIAEIIKEGCALMNGLKLDDFIYMPNQDEENCYLAYESQHGIIWDLESVATQEHQEYIDSEAGEGIQEPVFSIDIMKGFDQVIDTSKWIEAIKFPKQVALFFEKAQDSITKYFK